MGYNNITISLADMGYNNITISLADMGHNITISLAQIVLYRCF